MATDVLVVEDDDQLREALCDTLELAGYSARAAADAPAALESIALAAPGLVISDVQMKPMSGLDLLRRVKARSPEIPVVLMTAYATIQQAVDAMREGAADYLVKPFEAEVLVNQVSASLPEPVLREDGPVAADPRSRELLALARRVSESDATVMIGGESGTGKEVLARYLHRHSPRAAAPFVAINCAAIPDNMLEAVLFGYEKGAFTGAYKSSPGKFEQAQGGTLLLDEIAEMELGLQAKLLRVLQEREVERLGGSRMLPLDIRVLATTNRDLRAEVARGRFREDLFYRLNVFPMLMPPLRDRPGDILPLAEYLMRRSQTGDQPVPKLTDEARSALLSHSWPGNVRELDNVMQRALILHGGNQVRAADLRFEESVSENGLVLDEDDDEALDEGVLGSDLRNRERTLIMSALEDGGGSRKLAAAKLGISPRTLRYKLQKLREAGVPVPGRA